VAVGVCAAGTTAHDLGLLHGAGKETATQGTIAAQEAG